MFYIVTVWYVLTFTFLLFVMFSGASALFDRPLFIIAFANNI